LGKGGKKTKGIANRKRKRDRGKRFGPPDGEALKKTLLKKGGALPEREGGGNMGGSCLRPS